MLTTATSLLDAALALHDAGCCVVPTRNDGSKSPAGNWKAFQTQRPTREQVTEWFRGGGYDGFGVVTGAVSANLEMFELEGRAVADLLGAQIGELATNSGLGQLWTTVTRGYFEITPSGGYHLLYRVDGGVGGNTKLARRLASESELAANPGERIKVLIETRGEGGFSVCAPSAGRTHPTGGAWMLGAGGPDAIPTITAQERDALHALARAFDQVSAPEPAPTVPAPSDGRLRPGDDFNARAQWADILHGWTRVYESGGVTYWRRPGKSVGVSATTGRNEADNLFVFTTSTEFDEQRPYSKFAAFALLNHGGDFSAASRALAAQGYGQRYEPTVTITDQTFTPGVTEGSLATVHALHPAPDAPIVTIARSDDGNAQLLVSRFGHLIRYCHDRGRWLAWDGVRWHWQPSNGGQVREYAKQVGRDLPDDDNGAAGHKRKTLSAVGTTAMLTQAATDPRVSVAIAELDADPWALNSPGGVVDLRTGRITVGDPSGMHTRVTTCAPDMDADPSRWQEFLADTFGEDQALIGYLQRLLGYSAVGLVGPHVLPFCHGTGGNGKGVFLEAARGVLGDYATTAPVGFLMGRGFAGHETEIARLSGARMVICSEVNEDDIFDEAKVKQLTGGDTLTARFMRADHFTFTPTHQLWLMGNTQPTVRTGGRSFWRRVRLIPFTREVADADIVDDLQGLLVSEHGPAVLAWIVAGAAAYATSGLGDPESVKVATADYARNEDTVGRFLDEACRIGGGEHVKVSVAQVREAYETWCRTEGEVPVAARTLSRTLARKGVNSVKGHQGKRHYVGISLLAESAE